MKSVVHCISYDSISCLNSMHRCCWHQEPRRPGNNNDNDSGCWKRCSHNNYNGSTWERRGNSCGRWTYRVGNKTILKFCFSSGAAAATNQTDVSFRSNKICIIFWFLQNSDYPGWKQRNWHWSSTNASTDDNKHDNNNDNNRKTSWALPVPWRS